MAVSIGYTYGWRIASEVLTPRLSQVDLKAGTLRLEPGMTKNDDDGRLVYLTPEVARLLTAQIARVETLGRRLDPPRIIPWLFPHLGGGSVTKRRGQPALGEPIKDFRRKWARACRAAGCPGMLVHDFRRTAARNLERAGVPRSVAMKTTGHRTEAVYRRYTITSDADLREAAVRLGTFLGTPPTRAGKTQSAKA